MFYAPEKGKHRKKAPIQKRHLLGHTSFKAEIVTIRFRGRSAGRRIRAGGINQHCYLLPPVPIEPFGIFIGISLVILACNSRLIIRPQRTGTGA